SIRWVRPDFTTVTYSADFLVRESARWWRAGIRSAMTAFVAAMWIADGNWSLLERGSFTSSFGWIRTSPPNSSDASWASTSLAFMFDEVPDPVWNVSIRNSASQSPRATSAAAEAMAAALVGSSRPRWART